MKDNQRLEEVDEEPEMLRTGPEGEELKTTPNVQAAESPAIGKSANSSQLLKQGGGGKNPRVACLGFIFIGDSKMHPVNGQ